MGLRVADAHVDVLWRMEREGHSFYGESPLQAGFGRLQAGRVRLQVFAVFVDPTLADSAQLEQVLLSIETFYRHVAKRGVVRPVLTVRDLDTALANGELGAILSVEGAACLGSSPRLLYALQALGVRGIGLTWNHANLLADGAGEVRGAGLTKIGREVIERMQDLQMWIDIAHLSDQGVQDIFRLVEGPVMASHANARAIHPHRRNLTDDVISELVARNGWMGLTFEGSFVGESPSVSGVFRHLDHILDLGGEDIVGLGSDFDGTSDQIPGLTDATDYEGFAKLLMQRYGARVSEKILYDNFDRYVRTVLPS